MRINYDHEYEYLNIIKFEIMITKQRCIYYKQ
jgi:hypothetical protein